MTDREMLELAAKAAGYEIRWHLDLDGKTPFALLHGKVWNPRTDDGDALRLAVKLGLSLRRDSLDVGAFMRVREMNCGELGTELLKTDPYTAARLAIVRAAAEIGKAMP